MHTITRTALALTFCLPLALIGCGADTADTPREAIENVSRALETGDKKLFMANVHVADADRQAVELVFDMMAEMRLLAEDLERAYGSSPMVQAMKAESSMGFPANIGELEIGEDGDTAVASRPNARPWEQPVRLVRAGGSWRVDLTREAPSDSARAEILANAPKAIEAIRQVRGKVGTQGYTLENAMEELEAAGAALE